MSKSVNVLGQLDRKKVVDEARSLQNLGLNVLPLLKGKAPFLRKGELKSKPNGLFHRKSTPNDIKTWVTRSRGSKKDGSDWRWENLGAVTGPTSGFFSLDTDSKEAEESVKRWGGPDTWNVSTGRGFQRHYRIPEGMVIPSKRILPDIDLKGEGGIAVLPPSVHHSGKEYEWINHPSDSTLANPPQWLISTILLSTGEGIPGDEYAALPEDLIELIKGKAPRKSHSGSGKSKPKTNPLSDEIYDGERNSSLFSKAGYYRYLGYEEDDLLEKLSIYNQLYCAKPVEKEEVQEIVRKVCSNYKKGDHTPLEVQKAINLIDLYHTQNPPKSRTEYTDKDIEQVFLEECLLHCSIEQNGNIELSIAYGQLADKANVSESTLRKALQERLIPSGKIKKGKHFRGAKSGSLILNPSIYALSVDSSFTNIPNGMSAPKLNKSPLDGIQSRWGKGKLGKSRNHLLQRILEVLPETEGAFTPKYLTDKINDQVAEEKKVRSTSLSRHLASLTEWEILERHSHGVYGLHHDWAKHLGDLMRDSGEFDSILNQRSRYRDKQEGYRRYLVEIEDRQISRNQWLTNKKRAEEENQKQEETVNFLEGLDRDCDQAEKERNGH